MIKDETTPLVIDIAKSFIKLMQEIEPKWNKAYLRFCSQELVCETKGSYVCGAEIKIINALSYKYFFHSINEKGQELLAFLGKMQGIFLLTIDSNFEYKIVFEYQNLNRWKISKLNGGTGIPKSVED